MEIKENVNKVYKYFLIQEDVQEPNDFLEYELEVAYLKAKSLDGWNTLFTAFLKKVLVQHQLMLVVTREDKDDYWKTRAENAALAWEFIQANVIDVYPFNNG